MTADDDTAGPPTGRTDEHVDDLPTVSCAICDREWTLAYELEDLGVGNLAPEQFALDHMRHTGHFPDEISAWRVTCRHCPEGVDRLEERPARRWAETHRRHTGHAVEITHASLSEPTVFETKSE